MAAPPPRGGLSLYDNLTDPNDPTSSSAATISSAPVLYNQGEHPPADSATKKPLDPVLRFQPIRRPQAKQPSKPKATFPKAIPKPPTADTGAAAPAAAAAAAPAPPKSRLADWAATEDDEWRYGTGEKRQRGGRKKKKNRQDVPVQTNWDDLYDPARPTNIEEYLRSDEKVDEVREWKALLYRHRRKLDGSDLSSDDDERPAPSSKCTPRGSWMLYVNVLDQINSLHRLPSMPLRRRLHHHQLHSPTTRPATTPTPVV